MMDGITVVWETIVVLIAIAKTACVPLYVLVCIIVCTAYVLHVSQKLPSCLTESDLPYSL